MKTAAAVSLVLVGALGVTACAPQDPVRSLLAPGYAKAREQTVPVDDPNAQRVLRTIADKAVAEARLLGSWSDVDVDLANTLMDEVLVTPEGYPNRDWGGGVYVVSILSGPDYWMAATVGNGDTCWYIKLTGEPDDAEISFAVARDQKCRAKTNTTPSWQETWPAPLENPNGGSSPPPERPGGEIG